jgi:hypothetical protein
MVDKYQLQQLLILPMLFNNNVETDTGFTVVGPALITDCLVQVTTVDATETLDIGLDGTTTNDANGLVAAVSVATAGFPDIGVTYTTGSNEVYISASTRGALLQDFTAGSDVTGDTGTAERRNALIGEAETDANFTYTESAGGDTFYGFAYVYLTKGMT